jgi:hypothetical protein
MIQQMFWAISKASKEAYSKMSSSPEIAEAFLGKAFTRFRLLRSKTDKRFNVKKLRRNPNSVGALQT